MGTAVARQLARRGVDVVLIERGVPGAEASWAAGGILSPLVECDSDGPFLRLCLQGLDATRRLIADLSTHSGRDVAADVGQLNGGTFDVAADDHDAAHLTARVQWQRAAGLTAHLLDAQQTKAALPIVGDAVCAAHFPGEFSLEPRALFEAMRADVARTSATVLSRRVLSVAKNAVELVDEHGVAGVVEADAVVVCAGAWTPQVRGAGVAADVVVPVRGQMLELQGPKGLFDAVVYGRGGYVVPRVDGRVIAGSTMERVGYEKAITVAGLSRITTMVQALVPSLGTAPVTSTWAGLRPGTSDGLPLLGQQPSGVWLASGHFRNGVLLAAVSGELMANTLVDNVALPAAFSPARFSSATTAALTS